MTRSKNSNLNVPISLEAQRAAWNRWNSDVREKHVNSISQRQAALVVENIASLGRTDLRIIEIGCGTGWMCEKLTQFGSVTGIDLSDEVLARAQNRYGSVTFVAGDFMSLGLEAASFDVVVTLETLSHFADQERFVFEAARLLVPGGSIVIATQNRPVLERWSEIPGPQPGQIRQWVDHRQLRKLLASQFEHVRIESICPVGDQGLLRVVNSVKLNTLLSAIVGKNRLQRLKERAFLGHTLMCYASRK